MALIMPSGRLGKILKERGRVALQSVAQYDGRVQNERRIAFNAGIRLGGPNRAQMETPPSAARPLLRLQITREFAAAWELPVGSTRCQPRTLSAIPKQSRRLNPPCPILGGGEPRGQDWWSVEASLCPMRTPPPQPGNRHSFDRMHTAPRGNRRGLQRRARRSIDRLLRESLK